VGGINVNAGQLIAPFSITGSIFFSPANASWYVPNRLDRHAFSPDFSMINFQGKFSGV